MLKGSSRSGHRWLLANCKSAPFRGHFREALRTADGGNVRPKAHVFPNVFLQLAAFIATIQHTDLQRSAVPLFERVHVSSPRVDLRRRRRRCSRPSSAVLRELDHLGAARANLLRSSSSWPSLDKDAAKFNSPAIHVLIQPGDERVLVVRIATEINPVMQNV
jgi:hypothetical protein